VKGSVVAEVQELLRGDAERALIHAVDDDGLEYRIEVPATEVVELGDGRGFVLRLSWALESELPVATEDPATEAPRERQEARHDGASRRTPAEVDAAFMALMRRPRGDGATAARDDNGARDDSAVPRAAVQQLATRLGLVPGRLTGEPST
jgi:hypothetical protein